MGSPIEAFSLCRDGIGRVRGLIPMKSTSSQKFLHLSDLLISQRGRTVWVNDLITRVSAKFILWGQARSLQFAISNVATYILSGPFGYGTKFGGPIVGTPEHFSAFWQPLLHSVVTPPFALFWTLMSVFVRRLQRSLSNLAGGTLLVTPFFDFARFSFFLICLKN